ncbi:hypothetical protein F4009_09220 [Candidatus Poribacteria bacterium]|nr:hypothetical protein [Candidatus Poribacteria bacterium]MYH83821.1 hypothetical protein [Candidatus Poribacteria bacterium]MYK94154.1 hypothetical protein [Candidatus Poribacteria bacterium]
MTEERKAQLYKAWDELSRRQLSNSENFGRAILSLSTAGLALSMAFMKEVVEIDKATDLDLLYWSWGAFAAAISTILFSYHTSQWGIKKQFAQIRNELKDKQDTKLEQQVGRLFWITTGLVYFSHLSFIVAILFTIIFIQTEAGGMIMPTKKTQVTPLQEQIPETKIVPQDSIEDKGAPKVEILPELPPNTSIGSEAPQPNTNTGSEAPQSNTGSDSNTDSSTSSQESAQSADK